MNNSKKIVLGILLLAVVIMTIAYASLSQTLNINSTTSVKGSSWNIHFANIKTPTSTGEATAKNVVLNEKSTTLTVKSVEVSKSGDSVSYEFDVVNDGSIDAVVQMVEDEIKTCSAGTTDVSKYCDKFEFNLVYKATGEKVKENDQLRAGQSKTLILTISFDKNKILTELPQVDIVVSGLTETIVYGQMSKELTDVQEPEKACSVTSGTGESVGDMITCGTESFYVIKNDGNTIDMLSQYNIDTTTNLQSVSANTVRFDDDSSLYSGSEIESYVNTYTTYLVDTLGVTSARGRLITKEELDDPLIGCSLSSNTCLSAPAFIYNTSYWTASSFEYYYVWYVISYGFFGNRNYDDASLFGVRPVIEVSKDDIDY